MAYPRRLLNDHETVVVDLHPHWWCLAAPVVALVAAMSLGCRGARVHRCPDRAAHRRRLRLPRADRRRRVLADRPLAPLGHHGVRHHDAAGDPALGRAGQTRHRDPARPGEHGDVESGSARAVWSAPAISSSSRAASSASSASRTSAIPTGSSSCSTASSRTATRSPRPPAAAASTSPHSWRSSKGCSNAAR